MKSRLCCQCAEAGRIFTPCKLLNTSRIDLQRRQAPQDVFSLALRQFTYRCHFRRWFVSGCSRHDSAENANQFLGLSFHRFCDPS